MRLQKCATTRRQPGRDAFLGPFAWFTRFRPDARYEQLFRCWN